MWHRLEPFLVSCGTVTSFQSEHVDIVIGCRLKTDFLNPSFVLGTIGFYDIGAVRYLVLSCRLKRDMWPQLWL